MDKDKRYNKRLRDMALYVVESNFYNIMTNY